MSDNKNIFIGSGKKVGEYDIVKCTIDLEKAKPHIYEYEGKKYLTFSVSSKREIDQYGKTHNISVFNKNAQGAQNSGYGQQVVSSNDVPF